MNPALLIAIIQLVAKVGIDAALSLLDNMQKAKTIDDAIAALHAAQLKSWEDYKKAAIPVPPPDAPTP